MLFHVCNTGNSYLYITTQCYMCIQLDTLPHNWCIVKTFCPLILSLIVSLLSCKVNYYNFVLLFNSNWILTYLIQFVKEFFTKDRTIFLYKFDNHCLQRTIDGESVIVTSNVFNFVKINKHFTSIN